MGRHTAADGSSVHPLVAEGLARRASGAAIDQSAEAEPGRESEVGWPAPPRKGHGLGWPGDLPADDEQPARSPLRGWRRLFGASPAA